VSITPQTKNWLRQSAALDGAVVSQTLLNLLERVEALEQRPIPGFVELTTPTPEAAPVATDEELRGLFKDQPMTWGQALRACYDLGRQHGAAQPPAAQSAPVVAPAGGLVERVGEAMERHRVMGDIEGSWDAQSRAAIREVAAWMRENETGYNAARWLEQEAGQ
jgi:tellurite resistance protein